MPKSIIRHLPHTADRGLLPVGTRIVGMGTIDQVSLTAYHLTWSGGSSWASFDDVHGRPAPVMPLVVLG